MRGEVIVKVSYVKIEYHKNADSYTPVSIFKCDKCQVRISDMEYRYEETDNDYHLCNNCAFKLSKVDEKFYLDSIGICVDNIHAAINNKGDIELWQGKNTPPWKRTDKQQRNTSKYANWRTNVFKRDNYTCKHCGQRGGELNAHHIKPYAKYKRLRYELANGLTLCVSCHRKVHKKTR